MFTRTRWWLVFWTVTVLSLILAVFGTAVYVSLSRNLYAEVDLSLQHRGDEMAANLRELNEGNLQIGREGYQEGWFFLLAAENGQIIANPQGVTFSAGLPPFSSDGSSSYETTMIGGEPIRLYIRPISVRLLPAGALVVGRSVSAEQAALHGLYLILLAGGGFGLLLSLLGAWFLTGRALIPIKRAFSRQQEFVADASHELRTPLTIIRSTVDLLDRHRAEPLEVNGELFDDLRQEILQMERLATDLLTLARQDLHQLDLATGEVNVAALVADVVRRMAPLAEAQGIALLSRSEGAPPVVDVDPDRLQQVLLILLDNARKHTKPGGTVTVSVKRHGSNALLTVADTGEGIPPEHLPRIFDRFYRVDRARSRSQGGAGLGLAIARQIIEAHDGQLTITSTPGTGTIATIRLHQTEVATSLADRLGQFADHVTHHIR